MKLSVAWINELLNQNLSADVVADWLTSTGLEVEAGAAGTAAGGERRDHR